MILWYEDESYYIEEYIELLTENGLDPQIHKRADKFLAKLKSSFDEIKLIIIDSMVFSYGNEFGGKNTEEGVNSGLFLLEEIEAIEKNQFGGRTINKIIFTNRIIIRIPGIDKLLKEKKVFSAIHKSDVLPSEFLKIVINAIQNV